MYPIQLLDLEITSACEPGHIGAVVFVVVIIREIWDIAQSMTPRQGPIRHIHQPELQRVPHPQRAPFPREYLEEFVPFNTTGLVFPFNTTGPVLPFTTTTRQPPVKVQPATQKVAERWQLVCGDNAARLPAQRLAKEEQRISSCLAGCSQTLKEASGKSKLCHTMAEIFSRQSETGAQFTCPVSQIKMWHAVGG